MFCLQRIHLALSWFFHTIRWRGSLTRVRTLLSMCTACRSPLSFSPGAPICLHVYPLPCTTYRLAAPAQSFRYRASIALRFEVLVNGFRGGGGEGWRT